MLFCLQSIKMKIINFLDKDEPTVVSSGPEEFLVRL